MRRGLSLLSACLILSTLWFAAPRASQPGANDGFLLFATDRNDPSEDPVCPTCEDIYVMYPDGSEPLRLTENEASDNGPVWSHRVKTVAFHSNRSGPPEIFLMNLDGSDQRLLVSLGVGGAVFPSFSHSGNELCFNSQVRPRDIYIVNIHGTGLTNLTNQAGDNLRCDWSPKNNDIAFVSTRHGNEEIYVMNADGSDESIVRLTTAGGTDANPAWSPEGDRIAFESNRDGNPEIYVMSADGGDQTRLTVFAGQDTKPTWSPKGDRIAFHRRIAGHLEVFTMNADGTDVTQLTEPQHLGSVVFPAGVNGRRISPSQPVELGALHATGECDDAP